MSNAFYQALGHDTFNPIAGRPVNINAQMGALELSVDKDWVAILRVSSSTRPATGAYRFGTHVAAPPTASTPSSTTPTSPVAPSASWDRKAFGLTSTGVSAHHSRQLLPSLRSNKEEGQANFVNPGIYIFNAGADFNLTPKLRAFVNANYLRFDHTEPLEILLFQQPDPPRHRRGLGIRLKYRPPLSENIVVTAGESTLVPGAGLQNIYNSKVLLSGFATLALTF